MQGVFRGRGHTQLIGIDNDFDLKFAILNVLVDLLGRRLIDAFDDMAEHAHRTARSRQGGIPRNALQVDATLNEFRVKHVGNLTSNKIGGSDDRKELIAL